MAVPFRRTSKRTKRLRRTHFKLHSEGLVICPHCGATIKAHHVCPDCGYYGGKQVLVNGKVPAAEKPVEAPKAEKKETKKTTTKKAPAKKAEVKEEK